MRKLDALFVESGHGKAWWGGEDPGAVNGSLTERDVVVDVGRHLIARLKKKFPNLYIQGVGVDTSANLKAKTRYINSVIKMNGFNPDNCLSVSLHCNAHKDPEAEGTETWYSKKTTPMLADLICNSLKKYFLDRGPKSTATHRYRRLYIDDFICPAVLTEIGFISNLNDSKLMRTTRGKIKLADSIGNAIIKYFK